VQRLLALARSPWVTRSLLTLAAVLGIWVLIAQREEALAALGKVSPAGLLIAALAGTGTVICSALIWRAALADLGDRLPLTSAAEIFLLGQLGKYLPGSVWPMVMQAELGSRYGVSRRRTLAASVVTLLVSLAAWMTLIVLTLPFLPDVSAAVRWASLLAVPGLAMLHPAVLGRSIDLGLRLIRSEPLGARTTVAGMATATGWALVGWGCSCVQLLALAVPLGLPLSFRSAALVLGGYALAWVIGLVVVIAPAGAGAREGALVALLAGALPTGAALVVALLSRLMFTAADLTLAGVAVLAARRATARPRSTETP
jgi:uncharacterized membrane protein YbhN (UPF0104 family)